jgi:alpha-amylase
MAYERAYKPFMDVLERFPDIRVTQHFTGPLLDWFEANQPSFLGRLSEMARAGQIEIMGGGYYEPMLCAIPERDAVAQIQRMNSFCEKHFGGPPQGMWLAERVWEPHLPRVLAQGGVQYVALDDSHFLCSGIGPEDLFRYYLTENEGYTVKAFPILERLRYMVPFHQVSDSIDYLKANATEDGMRCAVLHDDGEKFGVWPETFRSVYEKGWLVEFFEALTDNKNWLHSLTYADYLKKAPASGRTYITCASYDEMMEWALPTSMQRRLKKVRKSIENMPDPVESREHKLFTRGGFWRSFLSKYSESNNMQKRMLRISSRLDALKKKKDPRVEEARRLLHQGQCNCAYWHGVFGGLYLNHLRTAIYEHLIHADAVLDTIEHKDDAWVTSDRVDFDADGHDEGVLENAHLSLFFSAADGGTLFEWDYKDKPFNIGNTLTRREELYHDLLKTGMVKVGEIGDGDHSIHELVRAKEAGLESYLVYDEYRRTSLRDHFLSPDVTADELWGGSYVEMGDFATGEYSLEVGKNEVRLSRAGMLYLPDGPCPVRLAKTITLAPRASEFEIRYDITNEGAAFLHVLFGVEFAVNLLSGNSFDRYYRSDARDLQYVRLGTRGCEEGLPHIALRDDWQKLECGFRFDSPAARIYRFAIDTVSQSEGGQERVYQGSIVVPCWYVDCAPGATFTKRMTAEVLMTP